MTEPDAPAALVAQSEKEKPMLVNGYDAQFWYDSYNLLREAVLTHLDDCIREHDVAEEAILVEAIETAGKRLVALGVPPQGEKQNEDDQSRVDGRR